MVLVIFFRVSDSLGPIPLIAFSIILSPTWFAILRSSGFIPPADGKHFEWLIFTAFSASFHLKSFEEESEAPQGEKKYCFQLPDFAPP